MRGPGLVLVGLVALTSWSVGSLALPPADGPGCAVATLPALGATLLAVAEAQPDLRPLVEPAMPLERPLETHACGTGEIRPGAHMLSPSGCTMSWVLKDGAGVHYQTTAGHCAPFVGAHVTIQGIAAPVGEVVFTTGSGGFGNDIALVRIFPSMDGLVNATLCHWGGPLGVAGPALGQEHAVLHYGWGTAFSSQAARARAGALPSAGWDLLAPGSFSITGLTDGGDSGSPMMQDDGLAIGVHTHRIATPFLGLKAGTRLDAWLPPMEAALGVDLDLVQGGPVSVP